MTSHKPLGLYRTETSEGEARCAFVDFGAGEFKSVPERKYMAEGYEPPFERLPSKEDYESLPKGYGPADSAK